MLETVTDEDQREGGTEEQREEQGAAQVRRCHCSVGGAKRGGAEQSEEERKDRRKEGRSRQRNFVGKRKKERRGRDRGGGEGEGRGRDREVAGFTSEGAGRVTRVSVSLARTANYHLLTAAAGSERAKARGKESKQGRQSGGRQRE